jgi:predicted secreted protein
MSELAGKTNVVYILTGTTAMEDGTGAKVLGVNDSSYNQLCDLLEITQFGDDNKNRIAGLKDTNVSLSGNYYPGDTEGQDELVSGDTVYIGVYPEGTGEDGKQVKAIVENFEISASVDGKQEFSASLQGIAEPETLPAQS